MQEPLKYCLICGVQNNLSAQFCQRCGARYDGARSPLKPAQSKRGALHLLLFLVIAVLGCSVFGAIYNAMKPKIPSGTGNVSIIITPTPAPSPTPDLPSAQLLSRAKTFLARPYDKSAYNAAMDLLNRIPLAAKEYKESLPLKQKITKARERENVAREHMQIVAEIAARKIGAANVERGLLSQGYDATVTVSGPENRTIRITYALMSRPLVYQLTAEGKFLNQLSAQGFRKVILSDGYNYTWQYVYNEKFGQWSN